MTQENITVRELTLALVERPGLALKFHLGNASINPGYHVTEVRHAVVNSLDCGKGTEQWQEITIQLLDGSPESTQGYLSTTVFLSILETAMDTLITSTDPLLYLEFAPGNRPFEKTRIVSIEHESEGVSIFLKSERAVCKPFQRSRQFTDKVSSCCPAPVRPSTQGCCSPVSKSSESSCCR